MRIDHHAYQRATRVAGFGLLLQLGIGLVLLLFGLMARETSFVFASMYVLLGGLVWLSLIVIFFQHKMERLEALEEDELIATRGSAGSVFDTDPDEVRVAARRLRTMHKWLMPISSLVIAGLLGLFAWIILVRMGQVSEGVAEFSLTAYRGWAVSMCLAFTVISFIFSRFVAGMAKQLVWQNLRGGAGFMVGNSVVLLAIAVAQAFLYLDNHGVMKAIAYAIAIFQGLFAIEIVFNFLLNLYRPRVIGEIPRPAFDSRVLSLLAAPDSIVKSINEAVNYQFGFDITSSWGYKLLMRSVAALLAIGAVVMVLLNTLVIVEPHQQAVKLAGGGIVGDTVHSRLMWKLPWPFNSAQIYDVTRIRSLELTPEELLDPRGIRLFERELQTNPTNANVPFIVGASRLADEVAGSATPGRGTADITTSIKPASDRASNQSGDQDSPNGDGGGNNTAQAHALVDAFISINYRIKSEKTGADSNGLIDYLKFASDERLPRQRLTERERVLKAIALRQVSIELAGLTIDEVLATERSVLTHRLRDRIQDQYDQQETGVELLSVVIKNIRPHDMIASMWVDLAMAKQNRQKVISTDRGRAEQGLASLVGSLDTAEQVYRDIVDYESLREELGAADPQVIAARLAIENTLAGTNGEAARIIVEAERDRWVEYLDKRTQASRFAGELAAYRAAPNLYREREMMRVLMSHLPNKRKYLIGIEPSRFFLDVELKELSTLFNINAAMEDQSQGAGGQ